MIPPDHQSSEARTSIRMDARLDATTRAKVDHIAKRFHQPQAAVVCHIMHWGLSRGPMEKIDQGDAQGPVRHLYLYVECELHQRAQKASIAVGMHIARWPLSMVRQITLADFPASWQEATLEERSHDSRTYGTRFIIRLDKISQTKLQQFITQLDTSKAQIIRQLLVQAKLEDFPKSWHMRAAERSMPPIRQQTRNNREIIR
jgi:hypothetical protein